MTVRRLRLVDFRSHASREVVAGDGLVAISGQNGTGKTNLLEAVSLLAPGRGLRGAALSEMARTGGAGGFAVAALLADGNEIGTGTQPATPERRQVRVNGVAEPAAGLAERLSLSWLTPAMDRLFAEGAGARRRFLDRLTLAFEPGHARHATRYEAAMRARNALLAEDARADPAWLASLEAAMAEHGAEIAAARGRAVALLAARLEAAPDGAFPRAGLALAGWTDGDLAAELASGRERDAAAGRTLAGPHRGDLVVTHLDKAAPASRASTGEQKALLLGIVLAHAAAAADQSGRPPVLLLDEVAAHLDPARRETLFARLTALGGQVWMTGTETALFDALPADATRLALPA